jgi:predicted  nucleic acid-binding Zn-ribbon protein
MKDQLAALYELQSLDLEIARAEAQLAALQGGRAIKARLQAERATLAEIEKELSANEIELRDNELKLKSVDEKRSSFEKRLYGGGVTNPKELSAIEKEIKMLKEQQGKIDGRTLELYDIVEDLRKKAAKARSLVGQLEAKLKEQLAVETAEKAALETRIGELNVKRHTAASSVTDKSILSRYQAIRERTGGTAISKVVDGKCEGCHIAVATFAIRELIADKNYVFCESCGRILMLGQQ